jgi:transposase
VLAAFVTRGGGGRPPTDRRARLDGIFLATTTGMAWSALPEEYGDPDTLRRQFHRWACQGLFDVLLHAARDPVAPQAQVLRGVEHWLCCAYRRAIPIAGTTMAEVLGYASALRPADLLRGPSGLSGAMRKVLELQGAGRLHPAPRWVLPTPSFRLTSPVVTAIRRPLANTGRGRLPAQARDYGAGAGAACTAPP